MDRYNVDFAFKQLTDPLEQEYIHQQEQAKRDAFRVESRPIPEGLIPNGIPLGHIALRGDFEQPTI